MGKIEPEALTAQLRNINRGGYWFGIIGRLSMLWGALLLVTLIVVMLTGSREDLAGGLSRLGTAALTSLVYGWIFLLGRDAFVAIGTLIKEMEDVV